MSTPTVINALPPSFMMAVKANDTITTSGSVAINGLCGTKEIDLTVNVKAAPTGTTPTLTWTISEVDPGDQTTVIGTTTTGTALAAAGTQQLTLPNTTTGCILVSWAIGGSASPTFTQVYATLSAKPTESVQEQLAPVYEDNVAGRAVVENRYSYFYIGATNAGANIKTGAGFLHSITIVPVATSVITLWDNTAASGQVIFGPVTIAAGNPFTVTPDVQFSTGLEIAMTTAASLVTVAYR